MNLIISQMISLVCRYNDYVGSGYLPKNYLESCVFDDCETVGFMLVNTDGGPTYKHGDIVAANPIRWFKLLQDEGCLKLALHYRKPDKHTGDDGKAAPITLGSWQIEAVYPGYSNFWFFSWQPYQDSYGGKRWRVMYYLVQKAQSTINQTAGVDDVKLMLRSVLRKTISFAADNDHFKWAEVFSVALNTIDNPNPNQVFTCKGLINEDSYSLPARQLLYAASVAFVAPFNDLWNAPFKCEQTRNRSSVLMNDFYNALIKSLIAAINND